MIITLLLAACEIPPSYVEISDIDDALPRKHYKTMCVGLTMSKDSVKQYATERMRSITDPDGIAIANACICDNIADPDLGWDRGIAAGLVGEKSDDAVACFAELVADPSLQDREQALNALTSIPAPAARKALAKVATTPGEPVSMRIRALESVGAMEDFREDVLEVLAADPEAEVRAAAATALAGAGKNKVVIAALKRATEDKAGAVRGAALKSLKRLTGSSVDDELCKAMMEDPDPAVRRAAVGAFQGTKRASAIACLRERALAYEEDASVRETMLKVLKSSPHDDAAKILCDAIPFWMRSYVKTDLPDQLPGTDIAKAQNDRDWERSYACLERAYRSSSGYSCFAKMYIGYWFGQVGGKAYIPACPPKYPATE